MYSANAAGLSGESDRLGELTPAQQGFARTLGQLLARLWEQEQKLKPTSSRQSGAMKSEGIEGQEIKTALSSTNLTAAITSGAAAVPQPIRK